MIFQFFYLKLPNVFNALLLLGKYSCVRLPSLSPAPLLLLFICFDKHKMPSNP